MDSINEYSIIHEIEKEYTKIDQRWMRLHFYTFVALVLIGFGFELVIGILWLQTEAVEISTGRYIFKYIMTPLVLNLLLVLAGFLVIRSGRVGQRKKAYVISLLFVGSCFVFYVVHSIFYVLFMMFTVPILLTVVYSDYKLTTITAAISVGLKMVSELFVVWDTDKVNPLSSALGINNFAIFIFLFVIFYFVCIIVIRFQKAKIAAGIKKEIEYYQVRQKLNIDDLTGIYNRTGLRKAFHNMERNAGKSTYIFVMVDIDDFKKLNDSFGHVKGDRCLQEFAVILKNNCGEGGMAFRFGGDEFCILFKNVDLPGVKKICKQIQEDMKNSMISATCIPMTASFGIETYQEQMTVSQLLKNTDMAMYRAKAEKDSICVYGDEQC